MNQLLLDVVEVELGLPRAQETLTVYINVYDNSLSRKWLTALNELIAKNYHLEKNYCFLGFADGPRNGEYLIEQINASITAITASDIGYAIYHEFNMDSAVDEHGGVNHAEFNQLHRYFEDLQGNAHNLSPYYQRADAMTRWHIRQLNLLCHEFESWQLSYRKKMTAPDWQRPSQLMCWLNAPRFELAPEDYELFGIDTMNRSLGGVYVGVNKAVGKHHWEVFNDEGRDSRVGELTTTELNTQTLAAGDFDIEWGQNPAGATWQTRNLNNFRAWLTENGFNPEDKTLTIGHPKVGQVDLQRSFGTENYQEIWRQLNTRLNVCAIRTSETQAHYPYQWHDADYAQQQIQLLK